MNTAKNIKNLFWIENGNKAMYPSSSFGVINQEGLALSKDGVRPAIYGSLRVAKEIALYCGDGFKGFTWIKLYDNTFSG